MTPSGVTRSLFGQHQRTLGHKHSSALHPSLWEPLATQGAHGAVPGNSYWPFHQIFHQRLMNLVTLQRYQALSSASGTLPTWFKSHSLRQDIYLRVCGHLRQARLSPPTTQRGCSLCLPVMDTCQSRCCSSAFAQDEAACPWVMTRSLKTKGFACECWALDKHVEIKHGASVSSLLRIQEDSKPPWKQSWKQSWQQGQQPPRQWRIRLWHFGNPVCVLRRGDCPTDTQTCAPSRFSAVHRQAV